MELSLIPADWATLRSNELIVYGNPGRMWSIITYVPDLTRAETERTSQVFRIVGVDEYTTRAWLCGYRDGDSDGRILVDDGVHPELSTADQTESCPICSFPKEYHGCRWVVLADA